ncbi:tetratricopeptide repeat protein [Phormidium tenue FACHB-886]|nr:tetratricopeptide repeat protein [Phormidium tenue FACHB-886]
MLPLLYSLLGSFWLVGTVFWVWMLYDCLKHGFSDRHLWVWVLLLLNVVGAGLYFVICWLPRHPSPFPMPRFTNRWRLRDALWQAEAEVKNIGKAHQYVKLGDVLSEMGETEKAAAAYQQALEKEPHHTKALWGAAGTAIDCKNLANASLHLRTLVQVCPDYSYGDASLAYGQILFEQGDLEAAKAHLQTHLKQWSHPQGYLILAKVQQKQGQFAEAREMLETMIIKIKSSTPFQYRKNQRFVRQGEKMLKALS